jgi:hypothetical protein
MLICDKNLEKMNIYIFVDVHKVFLYTDLIIIKGSLGIFSADEAQCSTDVGNTNKNLLQLGIPI